jgi:hypothetical protein
VVHGEVDRWSGISENSCGDGSENLKREIVMMMMMMMLMINCTFLLMDPQVSRLQKLAC